MCGVVVERSRDFKLKEREEGKKEEMRRKIVVNFFVNSFIGCYFC